MSDGKENGGQGGGGPTTVTFDCQQCTFRTKNYHSGWRKHMLLEDHQDKAREGVKLLDFKAKKRAVVVFGLSSVKSKDVLKYFGDLAVITDFIYWKERPDFCILIFLYSKFRDSILIGSHVVQGKKLFLRALDEIPEAEWISICPYAAHPQEMDVDSGDANDDPFQESSEDEMLSDGETHDGMSTHSYSSNNRNLNVNGNGNNSNGNDTRAGTRTPSVTSQLSNSSSTATGRKQNVTLSIQEPRIIKVEDLNYRNSEEEIDKKEDFDGNPDFDSTVTFDKPFIDEDDEDGGNSQNHDIDHGSPYIHDDNDVPNRAKTLNHMMETFYDNNLMHKEDWAIRNRIKERLQTLLRAVFPSCELIPFGVGSTAISCGSRESLSIFVDVFGRTEDESGQTHTMDLDRKANEGLIANIMKVLRHPQLRTEISSLKPVDDKITFTYNATGSRPRVLCSLQATNFLTVQCCRIINFYCAVDERVRPILMILRHWAYHHQLVMSNPGHRKGQEIFHPAIFQWLGIYFLSRKNIIPQIEMLQNNAKSSLLHGGDNLAICNNIEQLDWPKQSDFEKNPLSGNPSATYILQLAQEMFEYFGTDIMDKALICVNLGISISREALQRPHKNNFTGPFQSSTAWKQTKGLAQFDVLVQHPLKLYINMTSRVSLLTVRSFQQQSRYTGERLKSLLFEDSPLENPTAVFVYRAPRRDLNNDGNKEEEIPQYQSTPLTTIVEKTSSSKRQKIKDFNIPLVLNGTIRNLMKTSEEYSSVIPGSWLDMVEDFNYIVWPACFGVKLYTSDSTPRTLPRSWQSVMPPFKGVSIDRVGKLKKYSKKYNKKKAKFEFKTLSERLSVAMKKPVQHLSKSAKRPVETEKFFSFDCEVQGHVSNCQNTGKATILVQFSNMLYHNKDAKNYFRKTLTKMYKDLWNDFCTTRILRKFPKPSNP